MTTRDAVAVLRKAPRSVQLVSVFVGIIAAAVCVERLAFRPYLSRLQSLEREIVFNTARLQKQSRAVGMREKLREYETRYGAIIKAAERPVGQEELPAVVKKIEEIASENGVKVLELKPGTVPGEKKFFLSFKGEGDLTQIVRFMHAVAYSPLVLFIDRFSVAPRMGQTQMAKCEIRFVRFCLY